MLEAQKAPNKCFGLKLTCAEGARKNFCLAEGPEKNLPDHLRGGGPREGGWGVSDPPPPAGDAELLSKTLGGCGVTHICAKQSTQDGSGKAVVYREATLAP